MNSLFKYTLVIIFSFIFSAPAWANNQYWVQIKSRDAEGLAELIDDISVKEKRTEGENDKIIYERRTIKHADSAFLLSCSSKYVVDEESDEPELSNVYCYFGFDVSINKGIQVRPDGVILHSFNESLLAQNLARQIAKYGTKYSSRETIPSLELPRFSMECKNDNPGRTCYIQVVQNHVPGVTPEDPYEDDSIL